HELAPRRRPLTVVEEHELDATTDARVVEGHLPVAVPSLDDAPVDRREVDLAELDEVGVGALQHVVHRAPLVGDAAQRHDRHALDHGPTTRSSGMGTMNAPPSARYSRCWSMISSAKFQASRRTWSGRSSISRLGSAIGMPTPGISSPCLWWLRSTTTSISSRSMPKWLSRTVPLAAAP